jgi:hypothetical protein
MKSTILYFIILVLLAITVYKYNEKPVEITPCPNEEITQSLKNSNDSLTILLETERGNYDKEILRLEEMVHSYKWGLEYIELYHHQAYKDFIRVNQFKEYYTKRDAIEFNDRTDPTKYRIMTPNYAKDEHDR